MRKLGQELGVEAMSLYNHVRDKEQIVDGIVDLVISEIELPSPTRDWKASLRALVLSARRVLQRHPWAPAVIESRTTPSPATFAYFEAVLGVLRSGGFSLDLAHHALHAMGSRVMGFTQELFDDSEQVGPSKEEAALLAGQMAAQFPRITEMAMSVSHGEALGGGCDDDVEFAFALDLILEGLERLRATS
jgi:AcrR family transcriptional regulator